MWFVVIFIGFDSYVYVFMICWFIMWLFCWFISVFGYFWIFWFDIFWEVFKYVFCRGVMCDYELCFISVVSFGDIYFLGVYLDNLSEVISFWWKFWVVKIVVFNFFVLYVYCFLICYFIFFGWNEEIYRGDMFFKKEIFFDLGY